MAVPPATIAFLIEHEEGHLNPTFRLARRLAARGHRVVYLGLADGAGFVRAQGFEFIPILEEVFPRGTMRTLREMMRTASGLAAVERRAEIGASLQAIPDTPYARTWKGLLDAGPELAFPWQALDPSRRLLYVSLEQADCPAVRERLARMRRRFLDVEGSGIGVRLIEELLAQDTQKRGQDGKGIREDRTAQSV